MREKKGCDGLADRVLPPAQGFERLAQPVMHHHSESNTTFIHFLCYTFLDKIYLSSRYCWHYMCFISLSPDWGLFRRGGMHFGLRAVEAHTTVITEETGGGRGGKCAVGSEIGGVSKEDWL